MLTWLLPTIAFWYAAIGDECPAEYVFEQVLLPSADNHKPKVTCDISHILDRVSTGGATLQDCEAACLGTPEKPNTACKFFAFSDGICRTFTSCEDPTATPRAWETYAKVCGTDPPTFAPTEFPTKDPTKSKAEECASKVRMVWCNREMGCAWQKQLETPVCIEATSCADYKFDKPCRTAGCLFINKKCLDKSCGVYVVPNKCNKAPDCTWLKSKCRVTADLTCPDYNRARLCQRAGCNWGGRPRVCTDPVTNTDRRLDW